MTQAFYRDNILPDYIAYIKELERRTEHQIYFQEDNDASHGTRSQNNTVLRSKQAAQLLLLDHPAQSPDLNPIEAIWNIIKKRLRGGSWNTVAEFKAAILTEWKHITIGQIRKRISEMRARCKKAIELKGARIKSEMW